MEEAIQTALLRLHRGFGQRALLADDPRGQAIVDRKLLPIVRGMAAGLVPQPSSLTTPPPRRIAVAMALAVYSQPHLVSTFRTDRGGAPGGEPLVVSTEVLEGALGLSTWELDDLREEVDRRAGGVLKQITLVQWLLSRYDDPARLFHLLFPGVVTRDEPTLIRRGVHLYAAFDHPPVPRHALYLPWVRDPQDEGVPLEAFRARYLDAGLKRALARGIGATEAEVMDLLERTVALLPREGLDALLVHDRWRSCGIGAVTGVGQPYPKLAWLAREVDAAEVRWQDWVQVDEGGARAREPVAALDALARHRVHHALEALQTDLLARRFAAPGAPPEGVEGYEDLALYDLGAHVRAVLEPLVRWTRSKGSATWLARATGVRPDAASALLDQVGDAWSRRVDHWARPDAATFPDSVLAKWLATVAALDGALTGLAARPPDPRWPHRELLFLFAAHYLAEAPADRGLMAPVLDPAAPGLAIGRWFWPTWVRLLDSLEHEAATTNPEFAIPDGLF